MKIVLLSKQDFLINEIKKSTKFENISIISNIEDIYDVYTNNEKLFVLHHLDLNDEINDTYNFFVENFLDIKLLALRNNTNNIEGCSVLKKGYKAYISSISNINIIESAIETVIAGNVWMYPELMQFLISSVEVNDNKQNQLISELNTKELEVLELVSQGLSNAQIADILNLAQVTVKKHISSLFKKLDVKDRLSLALAYKNYR